jgi:hypothetical protein
MLNGIDIRQRRITERENRYRDVIPMAEKLVEMGIEPDRVLVLQEAVMYMVEIEGIDITESAQKIL